MRTPSPFTRTALIAAGTIALAACGGDLTDEEVPYNEGNSETAEVMEPGTVGEAVPAPEGVADVPPGGAEGVTPNTVEGVGTDDAIEEGSAY